MNDTELLEKIKIGETVDLECKEGESNIPNSLWESYSAMANTNGGVIILGIKEIRPKGIFELLKVRLKRNVDNNDDRRRAPTSADEKLFRLKNHPIVFTNIG